MDHPRSSCSNINNPFTKIIGIKMTIRLYQFVEELGKCNNMTVIHPDRWPEHIHYSYMLLEEQCNRFDDREMILMVDGDEDEVLVMVKEKKTHHLHEFLNNIFDGSLGHLFFYDPYTI